MHAICTCMNEGFNGNKSYILYMYILIELPIINILNYYYYVNSTEMLAYFLISRFNLNILIVGCVPPNAVYKNIAREVKTNARGTQS